MRFMMGGVEGVGVGLNWLIFFYDGSTSLKVGGR